MNKAEVANASTHAARWLAMTGMLTTSDFMWRLPIPLNRSGGKQRHAGRRIARTSIALSTPGQTIQTVRSCDRA